MFKIALRDHSKNDSGKAAKEVSISSAILVDVLMVIQQTAGTGGFRRCCLGTSEKREVAK
jgi:hypothetical protein